MKNKRIMLWITAALPLVLAALSYAALPDTIAVHWGIDGTPNGFAPRLAVLPLGAIGLLITALLLWAASRDQRQDNRKRSRWFLESMAVLMNLLILATVAMTVSEARHPGRLQVGCLAAMMVGVLFVWMGNYLPKVKRNGLIGTRNRWTLCSDTVWKQTQRISGWMLFVGGLLMIVSALALPLRMCFAAVFVIAGVCAAGSVLVSAVLYRREMVK